MAARKLAMNVIEQCAGKLEADIKQFLISSMSGDSKTAKYPLDYHEVIYDVYRCAPQILSGVVPYLTGELLVNSCSLALYSFSSQFLQDEAVCAEYFVFQYLDSVTLYATICFFFLFALSSKFEFRCH